MEITVNGVTYVKQRTNILGYCTGCVASEEPEGHLCEAIQKEYFGFCPNDIIWGLKDSEESTAPPELEIQWAPNSLSFGPDDPHEGKIGQGTHAGLCVYYKGNSYFLRCPSYEYTEELVEALRKIVTSD